MRYLDKTARVLISRCLHFRHDSATSLLSPGNEGIAKWHCMRPQTPSSRAGGLIPATDRTFQDFQVSTVLVTLTTKIRRRGYWGSSSGLTVVKTTRLSHVCVKPHYSFARGEWVFFVHQGPHDRSCF